MENTCKNCGYKFLFLENPKDNTSWTWGCTLHKEEVKTGIGCLQKFDMETAKEKRKKK